MLPSAYYLFSSIGSFGVQLILSEKDFSTLPRPLSRSFFVAHLRDAFPFEFFTQALNWPKEFFSHVP